jgi:hypothetical protein
VQRRYDAGKVAIMIELAEQQMQALENLEASPPCVVNPRTKETFVLLRVAEYERLKEGEYDDSPWTREELQALGWEAAKHAGGRTWTSTGNWCHICFITFGKTNVIPIPSYFLERQEQGTGGCPCLPLVRPRLGVDYRQSFKLWNSRAIW